MEDDTTENPPTDDFGKHEAKNLEDAKMTTNIEKPDDPPKGSGSTE